MRAKAGEEIKREIHDSVCCELLRPRKFPQVFLLRFSDDAEQLIELKDQARMQRFAIASTKPLKRVWVGIRAVHKGTKYDDTCISEIKFNERKTTGKSP